MPTIEDMTVWCCRQLGITRERAQPIAAALIQAVTDEQQRCWQAVHRYLLGKVPSDLLAGLTDCLEPELPVVERCRETPGRPGSSGRRVSRFKHCDGSRGDER